MAEGGGMPAFMGEARLVISSPTTLKSGQIPHHPTKSRLFGKIKNGCVMALTPDSTANHAKYTNERTHHPKP
jgi:hypothetical protein